MAALTIKLMIANESERKVFVPNEIKILFSEKIIKV